MAGRHSTQSPEAPDSGAFDTQPIQDEATPASGPAQYAEPTPDGPPPSGNGPAQFVG